MSHTTAQIPANLLYITPLTADNDNDNGIIFIE